eukprot:5126912-Amphidinium_carterae.1
MVEGVVLPDVLRQAAEALETWPKDDDVPASMRRLLEVFTSTAHRDLFLQHCPQAVVLAVFLQSSVAKDGSLELLNKLREILAVMANPSEVQSRSLWRVPPKWTGEPWEMPLRKAQQRSSVVLFSTGGT